MRRFFSISVFFYLILLSQKYIRCKTDIKVYRFALSGDLLEREKERERERGREKERERKRERKRDREKGRKRERKKERERKERKKREKERELPIFHSKDYTQVTHYP